ncbi:MAG: SIMPL domain-containing protein [Caulobacter sp.]|nr:SIMPL domain-containing protein [Caulobacter sp.]
MRRIVIAAACAFAIATPGVAIAAPAEIVVMGVGAAERPADWANVAFVIIGSGKTSVEALQALTKQQGLIESRLAALQGATSVRIQTGDLKVSAVRGEECEGANAYRPTPLMSEGACAIKGYAVMMEVNVRLAPASQAGNAASLAAELGALEVHLSGFGVDDDAALKGAATRDAVQNGRTQADTIANASGVTLGPVIRMQDPSAAGYDRFGDEDVPLAAEAAAAAAPARRSAPTVDVKISVPPVRVSSRLSMVFTVRE